MLYSLRCEAALAAEQGLAAAALAAAQAGLHLILTLKILFLVDMHHKIKIFLVDCFLIKFAK